MKWLEKRRLMGWAAMLLCGAVAKVPAETATGESNTLAVDTRSGGLLPLSQDYDGDGCANCDEYLAGTDPRDARSRFVVAEWTTAPNGGVGVVCAVGWASVSGRLYRVERSFDLKAWDVLSDNIDPSPPMNTLNDEIIPAPVKVFYRVVVK